MRLAHAVSFVIVAGSLSACSGDSFGPTPGGGSSGTAGTSVGGAGPGSTGGKAGASPGSGGTTGDAGASAAAGSAGSETTAGAAGANGDGGTSTDGGSGGSIVGGGAGGKGGGGGQGGANAGASGKGGTSGKGGASGEAGAAGEGGTNAGGGSAGTGGASGAAGSAGSTGTGGTTGAAGGGGSAGCNRLPTCGDQTIGLAEACDITACDDAYCTAGCQATEAALSYRATELCVAGVCWMFVADEASARNGGGGGTGTCNKLKADGRVWSLAWFTKKAEIDSLLAVAPQLFPLGAKYKSAWVAPLFITNQGWTQPEAPVGTMPAPIPPPPTGKGPLATKVEVTLGAAKLVHGDPSSGNAYVICRANN